MRYLVTGKAIEQLVPPEQMTAMIEHLIIPSLDAMAKLERDGKGTEAGAKRSRNMLQQMKSAG